MMRNAFELLALATQKWPPPHGMSHALTLKDGVLAMNVARTDGIWTCVRFDGAEDLDYSPSTALEHIAPLVESNPTDSLSSDDYIPADRNDRHGCHKCGELGGFVGINGGHPVDGMTGETGVTAEKR